MTQTVAALPASASTRYPFRYAVVDVETTGFHPAADRVLQVAVAQIEADGSVARTWSTLLDPGCDPGPVEIHGLTRERLAGAPLFASVAAELAALLEGRVLVAHNAAFDWRFLAAEAQRALHPLPVTERLCTLALTRRLDLPVSSLSLAAVAAHWGVMQQRPHDAEDDARVLAEILRHSLAEADRLAVELPFSACDADEEPRVYPARAPRTVCPWRFPGRWVPGQRLVQGMKVVVTGATDEPREALVARATAAGLDVMNSVSGRTGLLVANDRDAATGKLRAARRHDVPVVGEDVFVELIGDVAAGVPRPREPETETIRALVPGPLAGRCYLVVGGSHAEAADTRARIGALGGLAAVNLTARVTHVVALSDADRDRRWSRILSLELPQCDPSSLEPCNGRVSEPAAPSSAQVLARGAVVDLPAECPEWTVSVLWSGTADVDVVAFLTDSEEQVRADPDFVFYNAPAAADGAVELTLDLRGEALVDLRLDRVPEDVSRIVLAATLPGEATFGELGPVELVVRTGEGETRIRSTLDAATTERSLLLAHVYRRGGRWRFRAVGQGYEYGLAELATLHGVEIAAD